ncbi:MAG: MXAN_6640 family putative metalloprotease [candidate division Zixibacteria bacterium]
MRIIARAIITISLLASAGFAGQEDDPVEFLSVKIAELKGEIPRVSLDDNLPPQKCGTPVTTAAKFYTLVENETLLETLDRPVDLPESFGGAHILVHYALTGLDAPYQVNVDTNPADGVPDFVNRTLEALEYVYDYQTVTLGFTTPLTDSGRGGDNRYDVYLENLGAGFYGFTKPEDVIDGYRANSYIVIENDFAGSYYATEPENGMKVTAAHEFFHAIQFSYDALEFDFENPNNPNSYRPWWFEASATWMEDVIYDDINDYVGYLPFFLGYSWMGLGSFSYNYGDARSYHPYGACLWPIYMTEKYGVDIVREIWEICGQTGGYNALYAMESVLQSRSSSLSDGFLEFTVWNFHSGNFADPLNFYSEGALFPEVDTAGYIGNLDVLPVHISFLSNPPEHLAANYIIVATNDKPGGLRVNFDGEDLASASWYTGLLAYWPGDSEWRDMGVGYGSGAGTDEWRDWDFFSYLVVIPTVSGLTPVHNRQFGFDGWVVFDPGLIGDPDLTEGFKLLPAYPSPFVIGGNGLTMNIPYSLNQRYSRDLLKVSVFDATGSLVIELPTESVPSTSPGYHENGITWDGKNDNNSYVASGIYIVHMEAEDKSTHTKIAVVNGN